MLDSASVCWRQATDLSLHNLTFVVSNLFLCLLTVCTIFGNLLVVVAVTSSRRLRHNVNSLLITSLACADLCVGIVVLPFSIANETLNHIWIFGDVWCRVWLTVDIWLCTASIFNLVAISFDRYLAITKPLAYPAIITHRKGNLFILAVWLLSFLVCLPSTISWSLDSTSTDAVDSISSRHEILSSDNSSSRNASVGDCLCTPMNNSPTYIIFSATGSFLLPMCLIVFLYIRIYFVIRGVTKTWSGGVLNIGNKLRHSSRLFQSFSRCKRDSSHNSTVSSTRKQPATAAEDSSQQLCSEGLRVHRGGGHGYSPLSTSGASKGGGFGHNNSSRRLSSQAQLMQNVSLCLKTALITKIGTQLAGSRESLTADLNHNNNNNNSHHHICSSRGSSSPVSRRDLQMLPLFAAGSCSQHSSRNSSPVKSPLTANHNHRNCSSSPKLGDCHLPRSPRHLRVAGGCGGQHELSPILQLESTLVEQQRRLSHHPSTNSKLRYHSRLQWEIYALKSVAVVTGCFILSWLGFAICYLLRAFPFCSGDNDCVPSTVFSIVFWLGYINSALNPVIYAVFNREFRKAFKRLLVCAYLSNS